MGTIPCTQYLRSFPGILIQVSETSILSYDRALSFINRHSNLNPPRKRRTKYRRISVQYCFAITKLASKMYHGVLYPMQEICVLIEIRITV
ncbi:hypothetical protein TNCT_282681 [Trichonephila clavata]|uniref:Uncharacterized protein n=1 Tax=Trichonephila clavata TaxID=2740835 RepID=A0A8X6LXB6_TRICU|nr:hypothetical protein TNCT_282681 [Trichonephila clavata]